MWLLIQKEWPIVYFDATGNVCKKIENQKIPYFYSLTMYDRTAKSIVSIADFITTCHTTSNVCLFLYQIKFFLQKYYSISSKSCKPVYQFPIIMLIDQSDVLLNSILCVFSNLTIVDFLRISFDCTIRKDFSEFDKVVTAPYHDSIHLMRNFIKKTKKIKHFEKESENYVRKFSVFCFCLLQGSPTIEDFEFLLENIFNVFNQPNKNDAFIDSIVKIEYCIKNRNVNPNIRMENSIKDKERYEMMEQIKKCESNDLNRPFTKNQLKSIKKESPFRKYFDLKLKKKYKRFGFNEKMEENIFYNEGLFHLIYSYVSIIPLWTPIFVNLLIKNNDASSGSFNQRYNSNPAEKNFDILKNRLVLKSGAMPSEIAAITYERLNYKFERDYLKRIDELSPNLTKVDTTNESEFSREIFKDFYSNENIETWKKPKKKKTNSSYYYSNQSNISYLDLASSKDVDFNPDFCQIFSGKIL